jgi:hypothetical protein
VYPLASRGSLTATKPCVRTVGPDVHPFALFELDEVHEESMVSVWNGKIQAVLQARKDRPIPSVVLVKHVGRFNQTLLVLGGNLLASLIKCCRPVLLHSSDKLVDHVRHPIAFHRDELFEHIPDAL